MPHIFSVRELTTAIRDILETEFPFLWVRGEVTNLARPASGHMYFSLKDEDTVLNVVWFKSNQAMSMSVDPASLVQGQEVVCAGRIAVYPPRGSYQLVAEMVQDEGVGRLQLEFEALKKKLAGLGYFDRERKREIPGNPRRVAVVTSQRGAAIRDFLKLAHERGAKSHIRMYPSLVQGEEAPGEIAQAVERANADHWAEVLVLIRGGGSLEDLWAFNTETVARAVYQSGIPVVCGVGHEVDVSIADLVADMRAATPSHCAQILWPERQVLMQMLDEREAALTKVMKRYLRDRERELKVLEKDLAWLSPRQRLLRREERLLTDLQRLNRISSRYLKNKEEQVSILQRSLFRVPLSARVRGEEQTLHSLVQRLGSALGSVVQRAESNLNLAEAKVQSLDPFLPLNRGYGLIQKSDGTYVREPAQVGPGEILDIRVQKGKLLAEVIKKPS